MLRRRFTRSTLTEVGGFGTYGYIFGAYLVDGWYVDGTYMVRGWCVDGTWIRPQNGQKGSHENRSSSPCKERLAKTCRRERFNLWFAQ